MLSLRSDITKAASTHRRAYTYMRNGKLVQVKARGVAPVEEPKKKRSKKLTPDEWAEKFKANLDDWAEALGQSEHFGIGEGMTEEEVKRWLKVHGPRLRKIGYYTLDLQGKITPPTEKKSRKKITPLAFANTNREAMWQWACAEAGVPIDQADYYEHRSKLEYTLLKHGIHVCPSMFSMQEQIETRRQREGQSEDGVLDEMRAEQLAWYNAQKSRAKKLGIPLSDVYGNRLAGDIKDLPEAPWTQFNARSKFKEGLDKLGMGSGYLSSQTIHSGGIAAAQAVLKSLEGLSLVVNAGTQAKSSFHVKVDTTAFVTHAASYSPDLHAITIDPLVGKHSVFHEFGHYLDHFLGDFMSNQGFASHLPEAHNAQQTAVKSFIEAAKKTASFKRWLTRDVEHQKDYYREPTEMFARYFDLWCGYKLSTKGYNAADYFNSPRYTEEGGNFSADDFLALKPLFEKAIGDQLVKAWRFFFDLRKARTKGAKGINPAKGRHGALVSHDPSFYPGKGGMRYLAASEVGKVSGIISRYAKNGVAVTYVPPMLGSTAPPEDRDDLTPRTHEVLAADNVMRALDALRDQVKHVKLGRKLDPAMLAVLPDIGIDPVERPMSYLLSLGWHKQDSIGENLFTGVEANALMAEFATGVKQAVGKVSRRMQLGPSERRELQSDAALFILEAAKRYNAKRREPASAARNFSKLMHGSLAKRLAGDLIERRREGQKFSTYQEEGEGDEPVDLRAAAKEARIETPEQHLRRKQLGGVVSAMTGILTPIEYATVISRLNILNHQTAGISDTALDNGIKVGGLKPWKQVKEDVLGRLDQLDVKDFDREKAKTTVMRASSAHLQEVFNRAMEKMRAGDSEELAELADLQRLYLEGVRHETFDTQDSFAQLRATSTKSQPLPTRLLRDPDAFWEAHEALAKALSQTTKEHHRLATTLMRESTDTLRARMKHQAPVEIPSQDYARLLGWAFKSSIIRALAVVPAFDVAWAGLQQECTAWAFYGR